MTYNTTHLGTNGYAGYRLDGSSSCNAGLDICFLYLCGIKANLLFFLATCAFYQGKNYDNGHNADTNPSFLTDLFHISKILNSQL